jgi:ribosome-associated heat shock protein Hsp15
MTDSKSVRIDKYLWAVRIFKTRSIAADACRMGRILINNYQVKPSRSVVCDEIVTIRKPPVIYTFRVKVVIDNRTSAKLVNDYIEDLTPENEKIKLEIHRPGVTGYRKKGTGRPTKKERRIIDTWQDGFNDNFF